MSQPIRQFLVCPQCGQVEACGPERLLERLRQLNMLRRNARPDPELLRELLREAAPRLPCETCRRIGLEISDEDPWDDEDWGEARRCEVCQAVIPAERLKVFPDSRLCIQCQAQRERGDEPQDVEYCPRCGEVMQVRRGGGSGLARYQLYCPACRR